MAYNWQQYRDAAYNRKAAGGAGGPGGRVLLGKDVTEGLRSSPYFYLQWAWDNVLRAIDFAHDPEIKVICEDLQDWMWELDQELPYLTYHQRKNYLSVHRDRVSVTAPSLEAESEE